MESRKTPWMPTEKDKIDYRKFKPVLFQFPTYEYLETGDILGSCMKMN